MHTLLLHAAAFMRKLSECIFQMVAEDIEEVKRFHTSNNRHAMGKTALDRKGPQYWASVARRLIREAASLKAMLDQLWAEYKGSEGLDPATGDHLLTVDTDNILEAIKELIDKGCFCGRWQWSTQQTCQRSNRLPNTSDMARHFQSASRLC